MRTWLLATGLVLVLADGAAFAQTAIRPDPTPRLPPQAGQGLPAEDRQFITRALNLSEAEIEAARLAIQKANDPAIKEFSQRLATEHEKLREALRQLAEKHGIPGDAPASQPAWQADLKRVEGLSGAEFDRDYMKWQLHTHLAAVNLYQVQASNSPQMELASFAITRLAEIQRHFDQAKQLGARHGAAIDTVRQPPQY